MSSTEELACVYSSLILFDDDISITAEKLQTILKTANVEIEPYWPTLFAKALEGVDIKSLVTNISSGVGSGAPAAGSAAPAAGAAAEKKEDKKEEKAEESEEDDDMGFGLFD